MRSIARFTRSTYDTWVDNRRAISRAPRSESRLVRRAEVRAVPRVLFKARKIRHALAQRQVACPHRIGVSRTVQISEIPVNRLIRNPQRPHPVRLASNHSSSTASESATQP